MNWNLPPCWLVFIVPEVLGRLLGEMASLVLPRAEPYKETGRQDMHTHVIVTWYSQQLSDWIRSMFYRIEYIPGIVNMAKHL